MAGFGTTETVPQRVPVVLSGGAGVEFTVRDGRTLRSWVWIGAVTRRPGRGDWQSRARATRSKRLYGPPTVARSLLRSRTASPR